MDVSINEVISACMSLGMFISINQRLEADVIALITEEFGFEVQFVSAEEEIESVIADEIDLPELRQVKRVELRNILERIR